MKKKPLTFAEKEARVFRARQSFKKYIDAAIKNADRTRIFVEEYLRLCLMDICEKEQEFTITQENIYRWEQLLSKEANGIMTTLEKEAVCGATLVDVELKHAPESGMLNIGLIPAGVQDPDIPVIIGHARHRRG